MPSCGGGVGTVANSGTIDLYGVGLQDGGSVTNSGAGAYIDGSIAGVDISGGLGTVDKSGTIIGNQRTAYGIRLEAGGSVTNAGSSSLIEGYIGVLIGSHGDGTVVNGGTIVGTDGTAVALGAAGDVLIDKAGAHFTGKVVGDDSVLRLAGTGGDFTGLGSQFTGFSTIAVLSGARWTLTGDNTIGASRRFIVETGANLVVSGTVAGAGTLAFSGGFATLHAGAALDVADVEVTGGRVIDDNNLIYRGSFVQTGGTISPSEATLELASRAMLEGGALSGRDGFLRIDASTDLADYTVEDGAVLQDYATITETGGLTLTAITGGQTHLTIEHDATFALDGDAGIATGPGSTLVVNEGLLKKTAGNGASSITAAIDNTGTIAVDAGTLVLFDSVSGRGTLVIDDGKTLKLEGAVTAGQTVTFKGSTGSLVLDDPAGKKLSFRGTIHGFGGSDEIDLASFAYSGKPKLVWSQDGGSGTLTVTDGSDTAKITLFGQYAAAGFKTHKDGAGDTYITYTVPAQAMLAGGHR